MTQQFYSLGYISRVQKLRIDIYIPKLNVAKYTIAKNTIAIIAKFTIAKIRRQTKCTRTDNQIRKKAMVYVHNEILLNSKKR